MTEKNRKTQRPADPNTPGHIRFGWQPTGGADQDPGAGAVQRPSSSDPQSSAGKGLDAIEGYARGFQTWQEPRGQGFATIVRTFRLDRYDSAGNRMQAVPVEMRGISFTGSINEGDKVIVYDKWIEGQTVQAKQVYNLTHQSMVEALEPDGADAKRFMIEGLFAAILGFLGFSLIPIGIVVAAVTQSPYPLVISAGGLLLFLLAMVSGPITALRFITKSPKR
jgi:hypothetical protein